MDCKHIKREGESCPKNNNCRYPFCLSEKSRNTSYCLKCGRTIDFNSNSGLCLTCSINTSTEGIQTPPSSGEGSEGKKNINTNDLPSNEDNQQVLHKAHVMRSLPPVEQSLLDEAISDVITISRLNEYSVAKKLISEQFYVADKRDLFSGNDA